MLPSFREPFSNYVIELQQRIISAIEEVDGGHFHYDEWKRPGGGGGKSAVLEDSSVIEKGGVNVSAVHGVLPESMQKHFGVEEVDFFATGLSLVIHPRNPMAPTVHANFRYFEMYNKQGEIQDAWFGGGADLTPYYLFDEDAKHFHTEMKKACDPFGSNLYPDFKVACDGYFRNTHRDEARGVGGLFYDYLRQNDKRSLEDWYKFNCSVGDVFIPAYIPILTQRKDMNYAEHHRNWQEVRRGRYVEFNLIHDRGTHFGLKTQGRIESILMSLPPKVQWKYDYHPEAGTEEARLIDILRNPIDWI